MAEKKRKGLLFDEVLPQARRTAQSLLSLDPQEDMPASQQALEMALGFVPGVGQAMALRDIERARRAEDPTAGALAAASLVPFGRLLGKGRSAGPIMSELDVYHGTPHRFPATEANPLGEFDASKIGTGEGAQAYGHGIYYAESPKVAEDYRRSTSRNRFLTDNGYFDPSELEHLHVKVKARHGNIDEAIETAKKYVIPDEDYPEVAAKAARDLQKLEALKARGGYRENPGALYKADLPDEMIDRMLDWDKPLSQQSDYVKKVFGYTEPELPKDLKAVETGQKNPAWKYQVEGFPAAPTEEKAISNALDTIRSSQRFMGERGEKLYQQIAEKFVSAKNPLAYREASEELLKRGIPGIKYLDAGSRGQGGSGTRNFVVFPGEEKKVKILERK